MDIHLRKFSSSSVSEQETKNNGNRAVNYNKDLFFILLKFAANPFARTNLIVTRA